MSIVQKRAITDDSGNVTGWRVTALVNGQERYLTFDTEPSDAQVEALIPDDEPKPGESERIFREALDDEVLRAMAWDWAANRAEELGHAAAPQLRAEANRLGQRFLGMARKWQQAQGASG